MDKSTFLTEFNSYNDLIESALTAQNFDRVEVIDRARRELLQDFVSNTTPDGDAHFFEQLEQCASENAKTITRMTDEMEQLQKKTGSKLKALSAYRR